MCVEGEVYLVGRKSSLSANAMTAVLDRTYLHAPGAVHASPKYACTCRRAVCTAPREIIRITRVLPRFENKFKKKIYT